MNRPLAVMLTPDGLCQSVGAREALRAQLARLGPEMVTHVETKQRPDVCLWHVDPRQMDDVMHVREDFSRSIHVACLTHHGHMGALLAQTGRPRFHAVFVPTLASCSWLRTVFPRTFWVPMPSATQPSATSEDPEALRDDAGTLWRQRLGICPKAIVFLAIDDAVPGDRQNSLTCVRQAFAYVRARYPACIMLLWQRDRSVFRARAQGPGVVQLRGGLCARQAQGLLEATQILVRFDAGCSQDVVGAMQSHVLCVATNDAAHSGLLTGHNSLQIAQGVDHKNSPALFREQVEAQMVAGARHVANGTSVVLTRRAAKDVQCLAGERSVAMLRDALLRIAPR